MKTFLSNILSNLSRYRRLGVIAAFGLLTQAAPLTAQIADGDWQFRVRLLAVLPDEEGEITPINGDVDIDEATVPELDITRFLSDHFALELVLTTANHEVTAIDTDLGNVDVGDVWLLPPTLVLQYHLAPNAGLRPYIGAGVNYTFFYGEDVPGDVVTDADYENGFGFALQAGADVPLSGNWVVNADLKKLFLGTDVALNDAGILADVDINPWLASVGLGYRIGG